ncbi:hypothetical protein [Nannocystis punicea]|uniref:PH domain-containing protein n=1 Tax=Nannocystis punicea TaxID=2995304 RepID=A0ABY7HF96_9BACT|nr:hypothetical protein [Nannocystis poenicansa]WAS97943.1 hypothetical protein O0S08_17525 [Nannocystis poenicansa]
MPRSPLPLSWAGSQESRRRGHYRGSAGVDAARVQALWSLVLAHYRQFVFAEQRASLRRARPVWTATLAVLALMWLHVDARLLASLELTWFGFLTTTTAGILAALESARLCPPALPNPAAIDIDACPECSAPARRSRETCSLCGARLAPGVGAGERVQAAVQRRFGLALRIPWPYASWIWTAGGWIVLYFTALLTVNMARRGVLVIPGELDLVWPLVAAVFAMVVFGRALAQSLAQARALRSALGAPLLVTAARELQVLDAVPDAPPATLPPLVVDLHTAPSIADHVERIAAGLVVLALVARAGVALAGALATVGLVLFAVTAFGRRTRVTLGPDGIRATARLRRHVFVPREELRAVACSPRATWWPVGAIQRWELVAVTRTGDEVALARISDGEAERCEAAIRLGAALRASSPAPRDDLSQSTDW